MVMTATPETTRARETTAIQALTTDIVELKTADEHERRLGRAVSVFCRWLQTDPDRSPATRRAYASDVMGFADDAYEQGITLIGDVEKSNIDLWKHSLADLKGQTIRRKLTAVSSLFEWAIVYGIAKTNPVHGVKRPPKQETEPKYLPPEHFMQLLGACRNAQERAVLGCLYWGGLRRQEAAGLTIGDINLEGRVMRVVGKGKHIRSVAVCRNLLRLLTDHISQIDASHADHPVFKSRGGRPLSNRALYRWFKRWCSDAGLDGFGYTPHSARHGAGTLLGSQGFSQLEISRYLGHRDPRTTLHYVHATPEAIIAKMDDLDIFGTTDDEPGSSEAIAEMKAEMAEMRSGIESLVAALQADGQGGE